jgi:hypothetical protein
LAVQEGGCGQDGQCEDPVQPPALGGEDESAGRPPAGGGEAEVSAWYTVAEAVDERERMIQYNRAGGWSKRWQRPRIVLIRLKIEEKMIYSKNGRGWYEEVEDSAEEAEDSMAEAEDRIGKAEDGTVHAEDSTG